MSKRTAQLEACRELSTHEKVEICGLISGIKQIVRICRPVMDPIRLGEILSGFGLELVRTSLLFVPETRSPSKLVFGRTTRVSSASDAIPVLYVVRAGEAGVSDKLQQLEQDGVCDTLIGEILGIPKCCRTQYSRLAGHHNWLDPMLMASDLSRHCFSACNQFAKEYFGAAFRPDYFPCSFQCEETRRISANYSEQVRAVLGSSLHKDIEVLSTLPVLIRSESSLVLGGAEMEVPVGSSMFAGTTLRFQ